MKRFFAAGAWMALGIIIGAGAVLTSGRVQAQQRVGPDAARLVITPAAATTGRWVTTQPSQWIEGPPDSIHQGYGVVAALLIWGVCSVARPGSLSLSPWLPRRPATRALRRLRTAVTSAERQNEPELRSSGSLCAVSAVTADCADYADS